jgi:hypothetical protein
VVGGEGKGCFMKLPIFQNKHKLHFSDHDQGISSY